MSRADGTGPHFVRAHNEYLELAVTTGIPATLLLLSSILVLLVKVYSASKSDGRHQAYLIAALAISVQLAIHSLVDFPFQIPAISYLYVCVLAISVSLAVRQPN